MLPSTRAMLLDWARRMNEAESELVPELPSQVVFKPKHSLPKLADYSKKVYPEDYWIHWERKDFSDLEKAKLWVDSGKLRELADRTAYSNQGKLDKVCKRLEEGAQIGCTGRGRLPTKMNAL